MNYLSPEHKRLHENESSGALQRFLAIAPTKRSALLWALLSLGTVAVAATTVGHSHARQYICLRQPDQTLQCNSPKNNRPYYLTKNAWDRWGTEGRPKEVTTDPRRGLVPATNPYKPLLGLASSLCFGASMVLARAWANQKRQLAPLELTRERAENVVAEMEGRRISLEAFHPVAVQHANINAELDAIATDAAINLQLQEVSGEAEIKMEMAECDRLQLAAETEGMDDDQKRDYIRNKLMREGLQAAQAMPSSPHFLPGLTLGEVVDPGDKLDESEVSTTNALELLQKSFQSRIFFGAQRTGKSYLVACAAQEMSKKGVNIFHINLASYGDEDDRYWAGYRSVTCDLLSMDDENAIEEHIQEAMLVIKEFKQTPRSILIVDEWTMQTSTSNRCAKLLEPLNRELASQITGLTSTGMKRERALWAIAPEFVAGSLTQEGKAAKKLSLVFVAIPPGQTVDWNGQSVGFSPELYEQVRNNFPYLEMPTQSYPEGQRIAFIDKQWVSVGVDGNTLSSNVQAIAPTPISKPAPQDITALLEDCWALETEEPESKLSARQEAILEYARTKNDWVIPGEVQSQVRACKGVRAPDLIADFEALHNAGFGQLMVTSRSAKFRVNS